MANRKTEKTKEKSESEQQIDKFSDKTYLIDYVIKCKKEAEQATTTLREGWKELLQCYQNVQDYSKKGAWQSKLFIPKIFMAIERSSLLIERAILQTSKLFSMELDDEFSLPLKSKLRNAKKRIKRARKQFVKSGEDLKQQIQELEQSNMDDIAREFAFSIIEDNIRSEESKVQAIEEEIESLEEELEDYGDELQEDEERFKAHIKKTNFSAAYGETVKPSCLLGFGCTKRSFEPGKKRLKYDSKDIFNLYIAPEFKPFVDDRPRYLVDYFEMELADLIETAEDTNKQCQKEGQEAVYDIDEINKISEEFNKQQLDTQENKRKELDEHIHVNKKVGILQFWGDVVSEDSREKKKNQLLMIANEKFLIRSHDNPYSSGKIPYEFTIPIVYPHRGVAGVSMVANQVKLQYTLNNIVNMVIDNLNFVVNKMFEYNPYDLQDPTTMMRIFPGKTIATRVHGNAVNPVKTDPISADVFKTLEIIIKELQEGNAITEFLTAMPGKQAKTLGEIEIKTSESHGYFDVIARKIEMNSISKILYNSYEMLAEFISDYKHVERYQFNVGGLSLLLLQKQQVEYLVQALSIALKYPNLAQWTKLREIWERLLSIWNLDEAYNDSDEEEQIMQQQQQLPAGEAIQQRPALPAGVNPNARMSPAKETIRA